MIFMDKILLFSSDRYAKLILNSVAIDKILIFYNEQPLRMKILIVTSLKQYHAVQ